MSARCIALLPAAGSGSRIGAAIPKQYLAVAGRPMIVQTLAAFAAVPRIERIAVVVAPDDRRFASLAFDDAIRARVTVFAAGGATRDETVANGLEALRGSIDDDDWVLVHDAARCGITPALIERLIERIGDDPVGGLLAVPLDDTVKREDPSDDRQDDAAAAGQVTGPARGFATGLATVRATVDRRGLWRAQTPQMFRYALLRDAIAAARARGVATTDESSAVEAAGHRVLLVPGSPANFKVTTADDVAMMERLLAAAPIAAHAATDPTGAASR